MLGTKSEGAFDWLMWDAQTLKFLVNERALPILEDLLRWPHVLVRQREAVYPNGGNCRACAVNLGECFGDKEWAFFAKGAHSTKVVCELLLCDVNVHIIDAFRIVFNRALEVDLAWSIRFNALRHRSLREGNRDG